MRRRFKENEKFENISFLIETNNAAIRKISFSDKRAYLGFLEEIALLMNSKIIRKEVVHYMFGLYVIKCWKIEDFWDCEEEGLRINKESPYWALLRNLYEQVDCIEKSPDFICSSDEKVFLDNLSYGDSFFESVKRIFRKKKSSQTCDHNKVISITVPLSKPQNEKQSP